MLVLDLTDSLRLHVGYAVADRCARLRRDGIVPPPELVELGRTLLRPEAATSGQERPAVEQSPDPGQSDGGTPAQGLLLGQAQAAQLLGLSPRSFRRLVLTGDVAPVVLGGSRRMWRRADLLALVDRLEHE